MPDCDSEQLAKMGAAVVRNLNFSVFAQYGILHTKLWVVDQSHFYVGSANLDWRSLTQVCRHSLGTSVVYSTLNKIVTIVIFPLSTGANNVVL